MLFLCCANKKRNFMENNSHKAGFVNIIGNPNVGKSTLMNALVGEKLSIISRKIQTTRHRIRGIVNGDDFQIIYSDTPGLISKPHYKLHDAMMTFVDNALQDADVFLIVVEPGERGFNESVFNKITKSGIPVILIINKIDLIKDESLPADMEYWAKQFENAEIIPVSALKKMNVEAVIFKILENIPLSPAYFPKDELTDLPQRFFISEIIREKILFNYKKEIPYSVEVVVESFKEEEKIIKIGTMIYVMRDTQKGILLGHKGSAIKKVGIQARQDIEEFLGKQVYLELSVKINKDWRDSDRQLKRFGYQM